MDLFTLHNYCVPCLSQLDSSSNSSISMGHAWNTVIVQCKQINFTALLFTSSKENYPHKKLIKINTVLVELGSKLIELYVD